VSNAHVRHATAHDRETRNVTSIGVQSPLLGLISYLFTFRNTRQPYWFCCEKILHSLCLQNRHTVSCRMEYLLTFVTVYIFLPFHFLFQKETPSDQQLHLAALQGNVEQIRKVLEGGKVHVDCKDKVNCAFCLDTRFKFLQTLWCVPFFNCCWLLLFYFVDLLHCNL